MTKYIIVRQGYEYDDNFYELNEELSLEGDVFEMSPQAQLVCDRLNGQHLREFPSCVDEYRRAVLPYKVIQIEVT